MKRNVVGDKHHRKIRKMETDHAETDGFTAEQTFEPSKRLRQSPLTDKAMMVADEIIAAR